MRTTVYTCITSGYDKKLSPVPTQGCIDSYVLFTNDPRVASAGWDVRDLASPPYVNRANLINRYHKLFPTLLLGDTDVSIYIDGNIEIKRDIWPLVDQFLQSGKLFGCFKHPQRANILQELEACVSLGKFRATDRVKAPDQINYYILEGFPIDSQLQAATILFRKHEHEALLMEAMTLWWDQINNYTCRDQLSLPYILWKTGLPFMSFDLNIFDNEYFVRHPHKLNKCTLLGYLKQVLASTSTGLGN